MTHPTRKRNRSLAVGSKLERRKQHAMLLSMGTAATLVVAKLIVAGMTDSVAVLSEAVHSLTDLVAATIIWYSLRHVATPPDARHRYGHEKLEDISAIAEGAILLIAVGYVLIRAIGNLIDGSHVKQPVVGIVVMVIAAIVNAFVALYLRRVARETDSAGVAADAQQLTADVVTALMVAGGMGLVALTGWQIVDPIVALLVTAWVGSVGLRLVIGSARVLLDEALPPHEIELVESVLGDFESVDGYHRLRTRRAGSRRHVDVHLTLDSDLPLWKAHEIAHQVEIAIRHALGNVDVLTHIEPLSETPPPGTDDGPSDRL